MLPFCAARPTAPLRPLPPKYGNFYTTMLQLYNIETGLLEKVRYSLCHPHFESSLVAAILSRLYQVDCTYVLVPQAPSHTYTPITLIFMDAFDDNMC